MRAGRNTSLRRTVVVAVVLLLLLAVAATLRPWTLDDLFRRQAWRTRSPELNPFSVGLGAPRWQHWRAAELTDYSRDTELAQRAALRKRLAEWQRFDCSAYDEARRESCEVLGYWLQMQVDSERFRLHAEPLNPLFGAHLQLRAQLLGVASYGEWRAADEALKRVGALPQALAQWQAALAERQAAGLQPSRHAIERTLTDLRAFVAKAPAAHPLRRELRDRLATLAATDAARAEGYDARLLDSLERHVYPAWHRLIAVLEASLATAGEARGAWAMADGEDWYRFCVRWHTTTTLEPDALHTLGLAEVARLGNELDAALGAQGIEGETLGERLQRLIDRPQSTFADTPQGQAALLAAFRSEIAAARAQLDGVIAGSFDAALRIEAVPVAREAGLPLAFYQPANAAGSAAAVFLNLRDLRELPRWALPSLAHHEAVPGHHLESTLQATADLPAFRRSLTFSAYTEGWAMYAEDLAVGMGLVDDPLSRIGHLQSSLFRAVRLVVDTGLHQQGWGREHAIAYLREKTGLGAMEAEAEVDRYLLYPGQALSFAIGQQRFHAARRRAEAVLGEHFELAAFHAALLDGGRLPLDLLDRRVDRYIARRLEQAVSATAH